jgi:hypothetical protein
MQRLFGLIHRHLFTIAGGKTHELRLILLAKASQSTAMTNGGLESRRIAITRKKPSRELSRVREDLRR